MESHKEIKMKEEKEIIRKYYDDDPKKEWDRFIT